MRCTNSLLYKSYFSNLGLVSSSRQNKLTDSTNIVLPVDAYTELNAKNMHTYHQYCILANYRDELREYLSTNEIGTDIYYPIPLHRQQCFVKYGYDDANFSNTNHICEHILALPIYPELQEKHIMEVVSKIVNFYYERK